MFVSRKDTDFGKVNDLRISGALVRSKKKVINFVPEKSKGFHHYNLPTLQQ